MHGQRHARRAFAFNLRFNLRQIQPGDSIKQCVEARTAHQPGLKIEHDALPEDGQRGAAQSEGVKQIATVGRHTTKCDIRAGLDGGGQLRDRRDRGVVAGKPHHRDFMLRHKFVEDAIVEACRRHCDQPVACFSFGASAS
jgi:hypothetical protein